MILLIIFIVVLAIAMLAWMGRADNEDFCAGPIGILAPADHPRGKKSVRFADTATEATFDKETREILSVKTTAL